jgi:hypothetical protein
MPQFEIEYNATDTRNRKPGLKFSGYLRHKA